jgi:hypothetical protein
MMPEQQEEFEKAVQQHIQLAVNTALANMPQQPPACGRRRHRQRSGGQTSRVLDGRPEHVVQSSGGVVSLLQRHRLVHKIRPRVDETAV